MKVLFLLPYALDLAPGQRYRVEQWLAPMRAAGVQCVVRPLLEAAEQGVLHGEALVYQKIRIVTASLGRALRHLPKKGEYDAAWIYRSALVLGPPIVERLVARTGTPIIYDFDDAIWLTDTMSTNRHWRFLKFSDKTAELCRIAVAVSVGNETLAEYARQHNRNVFVIPSTVDTDRFFPQYTDTRRDRIVIGWSGSQSTVDHLRTISAALLRVADAASVEIRVMGGEIELPGLPVSLRQWSPEGELREFRQFDIGLMPLVDDQWSRGKCGMKALLYMSVGTPVVASPVGVNSEIIQDGVNGFFATSEDQWVEKLLTLVGDAQLRRTMGEAGRATVEKHYSLKAQAPRILDLLEFVNRAPIDNRVSAGARPE